MASTSRSIYRGARRKLVLAFDVGTTYSGISYWYILPYHTITKESLFKLLMPVDSLLDPGQVPEIKGVTR